MGYYYYNRTRRRSTYADKVLSYGPIAYWPLWEASGSVAYDISGNGRHGTYSNVTLGANGIGDGRTAASFNGTTSITSVISASLDAAFSGTAGTVLSWFKVSAVGVWTDSTARGVFEFWVDSNNFVRCIRSAANNRLSLYYSAGSTLKTFNIDGLTSTSFLCAGLTWDASADAAKAFLSGSQQGATQSSLGTWGAGAIARAFIGALTVTPSNVWSGSEYGVALYASALSDATMADLAVV